ncbi:MAG: nickel-dependent lactate racemase [Pyrinomonadaceae bacterium]|nr:nickel-dependent lactate racemase [Pyrinomonadaceae bacterium]
MPTINLGYGRSSVEFEFDENRFQVLGEKETQNALSDVEIGERFDAPVDSKTLEEIVKPGESVLFVVPDATRRTACGQIINLLVRRLIANGTMPFDIRVIFATGIHRKVTDEEKLEIVTPFIAQRIKMLDHNPRDLMQIVNLGETSGGIPIQLNRALTEHDHTIIIGGVNFHYFAGFTGGRKLICPGLASTRTVSETHKLAFDCETKTRREGVGTAKLDGNAVHEVFMEIAEKFPPSFAVNTIVNEKGLAVEIFTGNWKTSHEKACELYAEKHSIKIKEKREIVIASCGGFPHDINLIQAHKALDSAANACSDGGTIIFLAECENGLGRNDFLNWFEAENSAKLAEKLCESYQVNGQTAWSLLQKAEKFEIKIITDLSDEETRQMRLQKARDPESIFREIDSKKKGYILPFGAKFLIEN